MWLDKQFVYYGSGSGDGYGYGYGYGDGDGDGSGSGYGSGDGDGYGSGSSPVAFGRGYKLVSKTMTAHCEYQWALGANEAAGPLHQGTHECPGAEGDGLCIGWSIAGLTSGGQKFDPSASRLFLAEVAAEDALGGAETKSRARAVTLVREATPEEWAEVPQ
jgi:hypothetical protein